MRAVVPPVGSSHHLIPFLSSPIPLSPAPSYLLALNTPPPPGVGGADGRAVCDCGRLRRFACFPSCRAALSLPLVRYCPSPRHRLLPSSSHRCHHHRPIRPSASSSSRRRHLVITPAGHALPASRPAHACRGTGRGLRVGCGVFGCRRLACSPHAIAPSLSIWFSPHLVPVASCGLASSHVPTAGACGAVRGRFACFPVGAFQSFLKCCRVNLLKLCGSAALQYGSALRIPVRASPSRCLVIQSPFRLGCLGRIACGFCVAVRPVPLSAPAASRCSPRPSDTIGGAGVCWSSYCLPDGASDGLVVRFRLVVVIMRPCRCFAPCVPRIAHCRAAPHIAAAPPLAHDASARPSRHAVLPAVPSVFFSSVGACRSSLFASARLRFSPIVPPFSDAPPARHERRGEGRDEDGCLVGSCLYDFMRCYMLDVLVIYLSFLLYIERFCYISRILVICPAFLLYVSCSCYISSFHVILFCMSNAIMGGCV